MGSVEGVRVRGRGALMTLCRTVGAVAGLVPVIGYAARGVSATTVVVTSCAAAVWQVWLLRTGVKVTGSAVVLQGLVKDVSFPVSGVHSFTVAMVRQPGDLLSRSFHLAITMDDGSEVRSHWVAWQDMISPWIVNAERPLPARSQRVIDQLNAALATG